MAEKRILIVEDTLAARVLAVRMLTSLGYQVVAAQDADEALGIIDQGEQFDLLFTDIVMPGKYNGIELARIIKQREPALKILFTSGYSNMTVDEVAELDAFYVTKPYRKAEIAAVLHNLLDRSQSD